MRTTAREKILVWLREDQTIHGDGPGYLGAPNGVIAAETQVNPNTVRKVLGELAARGAVIVTKVGPSANTCYKRA